MRAGQHTAIWSRATPLVQILQGPAEISLLQRCVTCYAKHCSSLLSCGAAAFLQEPGPQITGSQADEETVSTPALASAVLLLPGAIVA